MIVAERGEYLVPVSSSVTWAQCYPDAKPPRGLENHKFWPTPEGRVIARPAED